MKKFRMEKVIVYFFAFIMVSSAFGIIFSGYRQDSEGYKYKDFSFQELGNQWATTVNKQKYTFRYLPQEVENLNLSATASERLGTVNEIDITSDQNATFLEDIAVAHLELDMDLPDNIYIRRGFTSEGILPIITCQNATPAIPVIFFTESNQTTFREEGNCIVLEINDYYDVYRAKDRLLYAILGII